MVVHPNRQVQYIQTDKYNTSKQTSTIHPNRQVQYYVTYSLKDGTIKRTELKVQLARCISDFPLTKTIEDNIV